MDDEEHWDAVTFVNSLRGQYLLSQALCIAVQTMESVDDVIQEKSNIADMKYMIEHLFPMYKTAELLSETLSEDVSDNNESHLRLVED